MNFLHSTFFSYVVCIFVAFIVAMNSSSVQNIFFMSSVTLNCGNSPHFVFNPARNPRSFHQSGKVY